MPSAMTTNVGPMSLARNNDLSTHLRCAVIGCGVIKARGITKKNPASEATRAGLSPVIRDPYASRYRPPAEQTGRSPRRLSRGETRGRPVSVRLIRSHVRVCIKLLTPRNFCKTVHSLSAQHRATRVGRSGLDEGARTAGVVAALNKGTPIPSGICAQHVELVSKDKDSTCKVHYGERLSTESRSRSAILGLRCDTLGIRDKPIAPGSPWQNGFGRLIGSIRRGKSADNPAEYSELSRTQRMHNSIRTARGNAAAPARIRGSNARSRSRRSV